MDTPAEARQWLMHIHEIVQAQRAAEQAAANRG